MGGGARESTLCHRVDYAKDAAFRPSVRHTYRSAQTVCILIALSPPAIIPDNGSLSRLWSSEVSPLLPDRLKQQLTG